MSDPQSNAVSPIGAIMGAVASGGIGAIAGAVQSVSDLVGGILTRADRDEVDKEFNENIVTLQNAFADNQLDSDAFRLWVDKLLNAAGTPLTATSDPLTGRRELLHALLVCAINLVKERKLTAKAIYALEQRK